VVAVLARQHRSAAAVAPNCGVSGGCNPTDHPRYSQDWHETQNADVATRVAEEENRIETEAALQPENKRAFERSLPR
jgi:hypothetical protein